MNKSILLIVNPCSGRKKILKKINEIEDILSEGFSKIDIYYTKGIKDGENYVFSHANLYDMIACAGGDGTFNEVVSGLVKCNAKVTLGYIPCGSTNDFAESLGLSLNILEATKDIVKGITKAYDIGDFNGRTFTYVASSGAFTDASYSASQKLKNAVGHLAYILKGITSVKNIKPFNLKVTTSNKVYEGEYIFGGVSNSTSLAGIFSLDKNIVDLSDGKFELILINKPQNILELGRIFKILNTQKIDNNNLVTIVSDSEFLIETENSLNWTIDGEYQKGSTRLEIKNLHNRINLVTHEK